MIHYITSHGIGNAWVATELRVMQAKGIPVVLHSLYRPHQNFFGSEWAKQMDQQTRLLYPLRPFGLLLSVVLAPLLFGSAFWAALANALFGQRESWSARWRTLAHFLVACHWARELRSQETSLIHSQWAHASASVGMYAGWLLRVPFSFTGHGADLFRDRVALRDKVRRAEFIVCISEFHRQLYLSLGAEPDKLHLVYCGIDIKQFPQASRTARAANASGLALRPKRILTVGRLVEKKGLGVLLTACAILKQRGVPFHLVIAGSGPQEAYLRQRIERLKLTWQVTLTGEAVPQEQLPNLLASADIYTQPCVWSSDNDVDGTPRTLMEAMATGLPCVASRIAGLPEIVNHGRAGLLVESGSCLELADSLEVLLTHPQIAEQFGKLAREFVERQFEINACLEPLAALFTRYLDVNECPSLSSEQKLQEVFA
jgi:colanic acid/amylovoran biosynthesis glycosyltransferase